MQQLPIPNDYNPQDGCAVAIVCFPNSVQWKAILRGAIYNLQQGRTWKGSTGSVVDVQVIGREIVEGMCIVDCQDLIDAINGISVTANVDELTKAIKELVALLGSQNRVLTASVPDQVDYTATGIRNTMQQISDRLGDHV